MKIRFAEARELATGLLAGAGLPGDRAERTAWCVVVADAWGVGSHGMLRLPYYLHRMRHGGYPPDAELTEVTDTGPLVTLDGGGGLGHWQAWRAAEIAAQRCARFGVAAVAVANSGHCGALGLYTVPGIEAGQVTLVFSNGPAVMPAWGGAKPLLSTSPLAAGIPARPRPAIVDMASSAVARGKIAAHAKSGSPLPPGWALDAEGHPTIDPQAALRGLLAPLGGAKGFALALAVEALAGGLAGPSLSAEVPDMFAGADAALPQRIGHLLIALDPHRFGAAPDRIDRLAWSVVDSGGRLPGERRALPAELDPGRELDIADSTMADLRSWAARLGVAAAGRQY